MEIARMMGKRRAEIREKKGEVKRLEGDLEALRDELGGRWGVADLSAKAFYTRWDAVRTSFNDFDTHTRYALSVLLSFELSW